MGYKDILGGTIQWVKRTIPGASQWNVIPGDVNQRLTGQSASSAYGGPGEVAIQREMQQATAARQAKQNVLGAQTTGDGGGTNYVQGGWYGNSQYWNGQLWPGGYKGNQGQNNNVDQSGNNVDQSGNISQSDMAALDASYAPYLSTFTDTGNQYETNKLKNLENVGATETEGIANIGNEEKDLMANLGLQGQRLEQGGQSAYSEAVRAYNALVQQGLSKYGMGSSSGGALGEIVGQEFLRSTGKQRQQLEQGKQDLGLETQKVKTYIKDKLGQVATWARDKKAEINDNFTTNMANLNMNKALAEGEKTRAKLEILKTAIESTKQLAADDRTFKTNLATFAIEQLSKFSGRALTPKEIAGVVNDQVWQTVGNFSSQFGGPTTYPTQTGKKKYDPYTGLAI